MLRTFMRDNSAATAVEYALILAGIGIVVATAIPGVGTKVNAVFNNIATQLK